VPFILLPGRGENNYGNSRSISFISEYKKQSNGNGRSRKWYGNRKMLVEVEVEVEMEMVVVLF
jgi:hypothetical protein